MEKNFASRISKIMINDLYKGGKIEMANKKIVSSMNSLTYCNLISVKKR